MKLIHTFDRVKHYEVYPNRVLIARSGEKDWKSQELLLMSNEGMESIFQDTFLRFTGFKNGVLIISKEKDPIIYTDGQNIESFTPENYFFQPVHSYQNKDEVVFVKINPDRTKEYYLLSELNFNSKQRLQFWPRLLSKKYYCNFNRKENWIKYFNRDNKSVTDIQVSENHFVDNLILGEEKMHGRINPIIQNEQLFIPLNSNGLLSLNMSLGKPNWKWTDSKTEHATYASCSKYIFQNFGQGLCQIDTDSGETLKTIEFKNILEERFIATGNIWVSEDYIICKDSHAGKICVLDAESLLVKDVFQFTESGIPDSPPIIQIQASKVFVKDMDDILRIYEIPQ